MYKDGIGMAYLCYKASATWMRHGDGFSVYSKREKRGAK